MPTDTERKIDAALNDARLAIVLRNLADDVHFDFRPDEIDCLNIAAQRLEATPALVKQITDMTARLRNIEAHLQGEAARLTRENERLREALKGLLPTDISEHPQDYGPEWHDAAAILAKTAAE